MLAFALGVPLLVLTRGVGFAGIFSAGFAAAAAAETDAALPLCGVPKLLVDTARCANEPIFVLPAAGAGVLDKVCGAKGKTRCAPTPILLLLVPFSVAPEPDR